MPYRIVVSASTLASLAGTWGWVWVDAVGGAAMGGVVGDGGAAGRLGVQATAAGASSTARTTAPIRWRIAGGLAARGDRKSTRLNSSHVKTSYAAVCLQ